MPTEKLFLRLLAAASILVVLGGCEDGGVFGPASATAGSARIVAVAPDDEAALVFVRYVDPALGADADRCIAWSVGLTGGGADKVWEGTITRNAGPGEFTLYDGSTHAFAAWRTRNKDLETSVFWFDGERTRQAAGGSGVALLAVPERKTLFCLTFGEEAGRDMFELEEISPETGEAFAAFRQQRLKHEGAPTRAVFTTGPRGRALLWLIVASRNEEVSREPYPFLRRGYVCTAVVLLWEAPEARLLDEIELIHETVVWDMVERAESGGVLLAASPSGYAGAGGMHGFSPILLRYDAVDERIRVDSGENSLFVDPQGRLDFEALRFMVTPRDILVLAAADDGVVRVRQGGRADVNRVGERMAAIEVVASSSENMVLDNDSGALLTWSGLTFDCWTPVEGGFYERRGLWEFVSDDGSEGLRDIASARSF